MRLLRLCLGIAVLFSLMVLPLFSQENAKKTKISFEEEDVPSDFELGAGNFAGERKNLTLHDTEYSFIWVPAGSFTMGSPESEIGRGNNEMTRNVTISEGYWILETPVTIEMWRKFEMESIYRLEASSDEASLEGVDSESGKLVLGEGFDWSSPGYEVKDNYPVTCINWFAAMAFCRWFSEHIGGEVSLPTEAEWEYACRAGAETAWFFGENDADMQLFGNGAGEDDSFLLISPVKSFKGNNWGIFDMCGNVSEWCKDWYADYSKDETEDPSGPGTGTKRVVRGGSWESLPVDCRSAKRGGEGPASRSAARGFRIVAR